MTEIEAKEIVRKEKAYMDSHAGRAQSEAFQMAINALEKQIAKKVIIPPCNVCDKELCDCECEHFAVTYRDDYRCPNCDSNGVYMQEYELRFDCCPNCGQRLDWS